MESIENKIAVVGVGRAGCAIVSKLPQATQNAADCYYMHTQEQYLFEMQFSNAISIETAETKEFGTNGEAYLGYNCIKFHKEIIISYFSEYKFILLVAGLGGGTGSGATPYLANILKHLGILCVSIVSFPFNFEGGRKNRVALSAYSRIKNSSDSIIFIDNNRILDTDPNIKNGLFNLSDEFMSTTVYGLAGLVTKPGLLSVSINDLKSVIKGMGVSTVGFSSASGKNRGTLAAKEGLESAQLFRSFHTKNIKSLIISITADSDMGLHEFEEIGKVIISSVAENIDIIIGTAIDHNIPGEIRILIIASGFEDNIDVIPAKSTILTETFRSITFEPEHIQAGISILSYFGEVIKQKYSNINARVRIERNNNTVTLIVESDAGVIEKIDKTLNKYGDVVTGAAPVSELLDNAIDIERLKMKLELAAMEIRHNQNIINLYKHEKELANTRIDKLEIEIKNLHDIIGQSLKDSNKITLSTINLNKLSIQSSLKTIEEILNKNLLSKEDQEALIKFINAINNTDQSALSKIHQLFINTIYGITGNTAYDFLIKLISTMPK